MRRLSGLHTTPLSPPLLFVSRRGSGGALPSAATIQRSLTCSPSVYDGSVTLTTIERPSGLNTGLPSRFMRNTSSCVIVWRCWAARGDERMTAQARIESGRMGLKYSVYDVTVIITGAWSLVPTSACTMQVCARAATPGDAST